MVQSIILVHLVCGHRISQRIERILKTISNWRCSRFLSSKFMEKAKPEFLSLMRGNRQTKVTITLSCDKEIMKMDRSRFQEAHFSTGVFKNPEATNEDVFNIFEKEVQELLQNFKNNESNWRVQRVISLDIHHVESQLFGESSYVWLCWDRKEERQEWRWRILSMVHSQTPQPLSVKPSENLTWKMRCISWISLGLNFQYPWLFWWCDFPTEIKFRWTWEHCEPPPHLQQWREEALMSYQTHDQTSFISNFRSKWSSSLLHEMSEFLRKRLGKVRTHRNLPRTWASHGPQA